MRPSAEGDFDAPAGPAAKNGVLRDDVDIGDSHVENVEHQRIERMMKIIDTLPTMQQTILRMRHMQGMEFKDIARLVGSEESTVRKALSRARMAVKDKYNTGIV